MVVLRALLAAVLIITALVLQLTVLPWLRLPGSTPDVLAVTVAAIGIAGGPQRGAIAGFVGGLALDLVPPAQGLVGLSALVLALVGFLAGAFTEDRGDRGALVTTGFVALLCGGSVVVYAAGAGLVADSGLSLSGLPLLLLTELLYTAVLAAFVVPAVVLLSRRLEPAESRSQVGRYER